MRAKAIFFLCCLLLGVTAYIGAKPGDATTKVRLVLIDGDNDKPTSGIIRLRAGGEKEALKIPELLDRLRGLKVPDDVAGWHVVPAAGAEATLPSAKLQIEALRGLETLSTRQDLDLRDAMPAEVRIKLRSCFRPETHKLVAGNTHLHLRQLSLEEADDYLRQIPAADGLRVLFISYLERDKDDRDYITNKYPLGDLPQFNTTGVLVNNGEEHRHNFKGYGEGYGHVMFLNIKELIKPVSIGPGIMAVGFDDTPLRPGIDNARQQGGTIIWCHNNFGQEDILNALGGRLHALNVFDGSRKGGFEENYYNYLNAGVRLSISTGTDWFMYDFARVYAEPAGKLTIGSWLDAVKAGRCQATNSPLLSLTVDGQGIGSTISLSQPKTVALEASAVGRHDFQRLQLVHNGRIIKTAAAKRTAQYQASISHQVRIEEPGWFAVRIDSAAKNEFGQQLFAHTSPVYVDFQGKRIFDVEAARALLKQIEEGEGVIQAQGTFSNPTAASNVAAIYKTAAKELRGAIELRRSK